MRKLRMFVTPEGAICEYSGDMPELKGMPKAKLERVSHIYPNDLVLRGWFFLLRRLFGDDGRVAAWTRTWAGWWVLDFSPSREFWPAPPARFPTAKLRFWTYREAVKYEEPFAAAVLQRRFQALLSQGQL